MGENKPRKCIRDKELAAQEKVHQEVDGSIGLSVDKSCGNGRVAEQKSDGVEQHSAVNLGFPDCIMKHPGYGS